VTTSLVTAGPALSGPAFAEVRRRAIFEHQKWDPQVGDVDVLAPYALLLSRREYDWLAAAAEALAAELLAAEHELLGRPDLLRRLGLGFSARRLFGRDGSRGGVRVVRFDFHPTNEGWRVSEANTDVPGGYVEAGGFTALVAEHFGGAGFEAPPEPAAELARALRRRHPPGSRVALVHATAYVDDRQVMIHLARRLEAVGLAPLLVSPADLAWDRGRARVAAGPGAGPLDAILRFFPAEWLPNLPRRCGWRRFFRRGLTPATNPASALLTQSKRFPLVWDELRTEMGTWRSLSPETRDLAGAPWRHGDGWVLKPAFGRVGEAIGLRGVTPPKELDGITREARRRPRRWAVQRRFESAPVATPEGPMHACIGVYTVGGRAAGLYGRVTPTPPIDSRARDVAVLVEPAASQEGHHP
jgi:glutathionylspermidine synthase